MEVEAKLKKGYFLNEFNSVYIEIKFKEINNIFKTKIKCTLEDYIADGMNDYGWYEDYDDFFDKAYSWYKDDDAVIEEIKYAVEEYLKKRKIDLSKEEKEKEMKTKKFTITIK